jgi:hypothetical protein
MICVSLLPLGTLSFYLSLSACHIFISVSQLIHSLRTNRVEYQTYTSEDYRAFQANYNYGYPFYVVDKYDFLKVNLPSKLVSSAAVFGRIVFFRVISLCSVFGRM